MAIIDFGQHVDLAEIFELIQYVEESEEYGVVRVSVPDGKEMCSWLTQQPVNRADLNRVNHHLQNCPICSKQVFEQMLEYEIMEMATGGSQPQLKRLMETHYLELNRKVWGDKGCGQGNHLDEVYIASVGVLSFWDSDLSKVQIVPSDDSDMSSGVRKMHNSVYAGCNFCNNIAKFYLECNLSKIREETSELRASCEEFISFQISLQHTFFEARNKYTEARDNGHGAFWLQMVEFSLQRVEDAETGKVFFQAEGLEDLNDHLKNCPICQEIANNMPDPRELSESNREILEESLKEKGVPGLYIFPEFFQAQIKKMLTNPRSIS